jgi:hypothetical protein
MDHFLLKNVADEWHKLLPSVILSHRIFGYDDKSLMKRLR